MLAKLISHGADPHMREPLHDHAVVQVLQHYGHNALVKEFPALVLQNGKTAEADLVSTESEEDCMEWEGVTCDGCLCLVSLHRYPCVTYLNHFLLGLLSNCRINLIRANLVKFDSIELLKNSIRIRIRSFLKFV